LAVERLIRLWLALMPVLDRHIQARLEGRLELAILRRLLEVIPPALIAET
jgi:hypothetical protein